MQTTIEDQRLGDATYSPEDNKIRFYPVSRLSKEDYTRARAAGFIWAPKQELFVAPMWTPDREDLMLEWCGELGDEDKSLVERAEERSERFEDYSERRAEDADRAHKGVAAIADNIPLGQPILVGHHSERRARKDAERIENGMRKAVKMWDQSKYWTDRAQSAIAHAKYLERPDVRARRIKKIEALKRERERAKAYAETALKLWLRPMTHEQAYKFAGSSSHGHLGVIPNDHGSYWSAYDVLAPDETRYKACPSMTVEQVQEKARLAYPRSIANAERWIAHYENRLAYERAMLAADGGLAADKFDLKVGGRIRFRGEEFHVIVRLNRKGGQLVSVSVTNYFRAVSLEEIQEYKPPTEETWTAARAIAKTPPLCNYRTEGCLEMTLEEWKAKVPKWSDFPKYKWIEGTETHAKHRLRNMQKPGGEYWHHQLAFITDLKETPAPLRDPEIPKLKREFAARPAPRPRHEEPKPPEHIEAMRQTLKNGIKVVAARNLFPTPPPIAEQIADLADLCAGCKVLEPSAGTGALLKRIIERGIFASDITCIEINRDLAAALEPLGCKVVCGDFLELAKTMPAEFDRVVMNPPFDHGSDIEHVKAAFGLLAPGGVLVAIVAAGPAQEQAFDLLADQWIELPAGSFAEQGTRVNTAIVVLNKAA